MSATTQTLCTVTFLLASTLTSATSAKWPWWLKWNASPSARPAGIVLAPARPLGDGFDHVDGAARVQPAAERTGATSRAARP